MPGNPSRSNPYQTGLRAARRREISERHHRAGLVGGAVTAQRHRGKDAAWAKQRGQGEADGTRGED